MIELTDNNPDVSVVIVSYNVKDLLEKCLDSIYSQHSKLSLEVIVLENASSDGSADFIEWKYPQVTLVRNEKNEGFPKANNQGFALAKGKYILMLNPDTEFIDNGIEHMYDFLEKNQAIGLIAPKLLNSDKSLQLSTWRFPTLYSVFCELFFLNSLNQKHFYSDKNLDEPFQADSFSGAALFFKSSLLKSAKGLDESMFWIEDIDFCFRLTREGFAMQYRPEIQVIHHSGQSAKKNYNISLSNQIFNKIKFFRKHHSITAFRLVQGMSFIHVSIKILIFTLLSPVNLVYYRKLKAYIYTWPKVFNPPNGIA
ncbi:MAG: glycosyltransferase family 2 protein [Bacteroidia bacterium]